MSKANSFSDLFKAAGRGIAETDKGVGPAPTRNLLPNKRKGKREHEDYGKIGVYIRSATITEVKAKLVRERRELSDLVQELLDSWLKTGR